MPGNWEDLFDIVCKDNGYYAIFKHNGKPCHLGKCNTKAHAESMAFNWANNKNNEKAIIEIALENMLEPRPGLEPGFDD